MGFHVSPALFPAAGRQTADVALHQRPKHLGVEVTHQDEGEVTDVGKALPVDSFGGCEMDLLQ